MENNWYVYIVKCSDGTFYTGISTDVERRIYEHNNSIKGAKYTKIRRPVQLVFCYFIGTRSLASKIEYKIKKLSKKKKCELITNHLLLEELLP